MSQLLVRILRNLRRPLPDLYGYLMAKLLSIVWRVYLRQVGRGFHVCRGARFEGGKDICVGKNFYAGPMLWVAAVQQHFEYRYTPVVEIGANVSCSEFVHIAATTRVTIHDGVLIGSRVHITDHGHGCYRGSEQDAPNVPPVLRQLSHGNPVEIGANVWLGDGVVVLPGVTIGAGSIVGANSVVSSSLPAGVIAVGVPARVVKYYDAASGQWLVFTEKP